MKKQMKKRHDLLVKNARNQEVFNILWVNVQFLKQTILTMKKQQLNKMHGQKNTWIIYMEKKQNP